MRSNSNTIEVNNQEIRLAFSKDFLPLLRAAIKHLECPAGKKIAPDCVAPDALHDGQRADDQRAKSRMTLHEPVGGPQSSQGLANTHIRKAKAARVQHQEIGCNFLALIRRNTR